MLQKNQTIPLEKGYDSSNSTIYFLYDQPMDTKDLKSYTGILQLVLDKRSDKSPCKFTHIRERVGVQTSIMTSDLAISTFLSVKLRFLNHK